MLGCLAVGSQLELSTAVSLVLCGFGEKVARHLCHAGSFASLRNAQGADDRWWFCTASKYNCTASSGSKSGRWQ
jgi:hypothetical protein